MADDQLDETYAAVRAMLDRAASTMRFVKEEPGSVTLLAHWPHPRNPKEPMWFGAAKRMKRYVSIHLMPIYSHPSLAADISPALAKRRQGKACFNLKVPDPVLLAELETLTIRAADLYALPCVTAEWGRQARLT